MYKVKTFLKHLFTPVTVMLIPHNSKRTINLKLPFVGIFLSIIFWLVGSVYIVSMAIDTVEYYDMKNKLSFYHEQFTQLKDTILNLKQLELEFKKLFSSGSKKKILENVDSKVYTNDAGSLDMDMLKGQIRNTVESVKEIKNYLKEQKNIYMATPIGWPIQGNITSHFGQREHPRHGGMDFHSGIDISAPKGTPVKAVADGIVSFSGWSGGSGNLVVIEHGYGYSTLYAHNSTNKVNVGQTINRGDIIAFVGATGNATGAHLHYEVWRNEKAVNPIGFITEAKNVFKEQ
ncbi:MAG: M23 family metallopeptidase [Thermodesulfovibrionales bacterium]|nr:M23 family metallopeptidase [Thermodesulfovibrionales bacterium]